jgi:hypothetical protein
MKTFIKFLLGGMLALPIYASAFPITDTVSFNRNVSYEWILLDFDLTRQGYNHETDTIKHVTMSYNFREIEEFDDIENEDTWESIEIYSLLFDRRSYLRDVSTETFVENIDWVKDYSCQLGGFDGDPCVYNLDLYGTTMEEIFVATDNLWFGEGKLTVEIDRVTVPEPSSLLLLCFGFLGLMLRYFRGASK